MHPAGVFSHHSALELLGAAYSVWCQCTLYVVGRRRPLLLDGVVVRFLDTPRPLQTVSASALLRDYPLISTTISNEIIGRA